MRKELWIVLAGLLLLAAPLAAQTTTTTRIGWEFNATPTEVATYTQTILLDGVLVTTPPTCAATPNKPGWTTCLITPTLTAGTHTMDVTAAFQGQSAQLKITNLGTSPKLQPQNPTINITVIVNLQ